MTGDGRPGSHAPDRAFETDPDRLTLLRTVWRMSRPEQLLLVVAVYALGVAIALRLPEPASR